MVETTRAPYVPYSFGDLMEGRLRRVGDPNGSDTKRSGTAPATAAKEAGSAARAGRGSERADFQQDLRAALEDSSGSRKPAAQSSTGAASASSTVTEAISDGDLELRERLARVVGASAGDVSVTELPSQDNGRSSGTRQYIVTVDAPGSGGPAESIGVNHVLSLPLAADAEDFNFDAISMVKDRLSKMGISSAGIEFEYWNDTINNVGGHRTFQYLSADLGNGVKENFSLEWTLYNPDVTAVEIARLLKTGGVAT